MPYLFLHISQLHSYRMYFIRVVRVPIHCIGKWSRHFKTIYFSASQVNVKRDSPAIAL